MTKNLPCSRVDCFVHEGETCQSGEPNKTECYHYQDALAYRLGKVKRMWAAYAQQAGGKTFDGKPLPTWEELGEERQSCWFAALDAI